ncbi:MAG: hypothetical protein Q9191_004639 [Dirinaria sp. TL-2023a]
MTPHAIRSTNNTCSQMILPSSGFFVALSPSIMQNIPGQEAENPRCNSKINIWNPVLKEAREAIVYDTCEGCEGFDFHATHPLFRTLAPYELLGLKVLVDWGGEQVGGAA